jgi:RNA polymerase sigma factor (sigma-70 family)
MTGPMGIFDKNPDLLDSYRRGDRGALREIYLTFVDDVETVVRKGFSLESNSDAYVPGADSEAECKDYIQECFIRAFSESARKDYDPNKDFRPYLLRIVKNLMIDKARQSNRITFPGDGSKKDDVRGLKDIIEKHRAEAFDQSDGFEDRIRWKRLSKATDDYIEQLDDEQKRFIELRYRQESSQREVAEQMDVSRRRVRTLQKWVRRGLKKYLEEQDLM